MTACDRSILFTGYYSKILGLSSGVFWFHSWLNSWCILIFWIRILDQELISYRYSSCSCCCSCLGDLCEKSLRLCHFRLDWDEIWYDFSSSKYALIDAVWRHTIKMAAMTSFNAAKCCYLVSAHTTSARHICIYVEAICSCSENSSSTISHTIAAGGWRSKQCCVAANRCATICYLVLGQEISHKEKCACKHVICNHVISGCCISCSW